MIPLPRSVLLALLGALIVLPSSAQARQDTPSITVSTYVAGLPSGAGGVGPLGVAMDAADNLWFVDGGQLYRADDGSDAAARVTRVGKPLAGAGLSGLAFGRDGTLYAARQTGVKTGDVVALDQADGSIEGTVARGIACPTGLAVDPVSGDVFVASACGAGVQRIVRGTAHRYADFSNADGLTFGGDGTLYVAHEPDADGFTVAAVAGTGAAKPGVVRELAAVPTADGIGVARSAPGSPPTFIVVNRNDGLLTRVDLVGPFPTASDLFTEGSRGDYVAVDSAGCLYATQSDSILRVTNSDGHCSSSEAPTVGIGSGLLKTTVTIAPQGASLVADAATAPGPCGASRRLTLTLRSRGGVRLVAGSVYLRGRRLAWVGGRRQVPRTLTLKDLPAGSFTLRIHGKTSTGKLIKVTRRFGACGTSRKLAPKTTRTRH
jgi:hypothetical protein